MFWLNLQHLLYLGPLSHTFCSHSVLSSPSSPSWARSLGLVLSGLPCKHSKGSVFSIISSRPGPAILLSIFLNHVDSGSWQCCEGCLYYFWPTVLRVLCEHGGEAWTRLAWSRLWVETWRERAQYKCSCSYSDTQGKRKSSV